jgi:hypothetical protein
MEGFQDWWGNVIIIYCYALWSIFTTLLLVTWFWYANVFDTDYVTGDFILRHSYPTFWNEYPVRYCERQGPCHIWPCSLGKPSWWSEGVYSRGLSSICRWSTDNFEERGPSILYIITFSLFYHFNPQLFLLLNKSKTCLLCQIPKAASSLDLSELKSPLHFMDACWLWEMTLG